MSGSYINPALIDPTNFQRRNMPNPWQPQQTQDLFAPAPAAAPQVQAQQPQEPIVNLAQELQPYQDRLNSASGAYQHGLDEQEHIQYPEPSIKRTLLGWLAGQAIPELGDQIRNGPARKYAAQTTQSQHHLAALQNAVQDSQRELNTARETRRDTAYIDYMTRRPGQQPPHETIDVMGPDGKPHRMQMNAQSGRYDIDAGVAYEKPSAEHDTQHIEVMHGGKRHIHQFNPNSQRYDIEAGEGVPPAGDAGAHGTYIPLTDDQGHVTGAWNASTNSYRPVPAGGAGGFRGTPNPDRNYYTAQRQATQNLSKSVDYMLASADEQGTMLEAETKRILQNAPSAQSSQPQSNAEPQVTDPQAPRGTPGSLPSAHGQAPGSHPDASRVPKPLDHSKAKAYLQKANGNKAEARKLARNDGYTF